MALGQAFLWEKFTGTIGDADVDIPNDTWKLAIIDNTSPPAVDDTDITWATIDANEVSGDNYTAGGVTLTTVTWTFNTTLDRWEMKADDISWTIHATGPTDCDYAVLVNTTTGDCAMWIDLDGASLQADNIDIEFPDGVVFWHKPNTTA